MKTHALILAAVLALTAPAGILNAGSPDKEKYTLEEMVVLSRHNIRSPLSGPGSVLSRITPHEWFEWTSAPAELSRKGAVLETRMGQYFALWLEDEGLFARNSVPADGEVLFYANSIQRTVATAQYFSSGLFPLANVRVLHRPEIGVMDPVFFPRVTGPDSAFVALASGQIAAMGGDDGYAGLGKKMAANYKVLAKVLDIRRSPAAANDTISFPQEDTRVFLEDGKEPYMKGGLKMACSASDALVLQYYEDPSLRSAAFGHRISREKWKAISEVKDWYGDILFTAPAVAGNVARPLLEKILDELRTPGRKFSFLCGHDSNIGSVLAALGCGEYDLPQAIEKKTPIGSKLVFRKYAGADGVLYADVQLVYASDTQIRAESDLGPDNPPVFFPLRLEGLEANADGLYLLSDLESRFAEVIR